MTGRGRGEALAAAGWALVSVGAVPLIIGLILGFGPALRAHVASPADHASVYCGKAFLPEGNAARLWMRDQQGSDVFGGRVTDAVSACHREQSDALTAPLILTVAGGGLVVLAAAGLLVPARVLRTQPA